MPKITGPLTSLVWLPVLLLTACAGEGTTGAGGTTTPTPVSSPTPPGSGDTVVIGTSPGLCTPGDVARVDVDTSGRARFPLYTSDAACTKDNRQEEYTLIMYNTTASAMTFSLYAPINPTPPSTSAIGVRTNEAEDIPVKPPVASAQYKTGVNETDQQATAMARFKSVNKKSSALSRLGVSRYRNLSAGDEVEFKVRSNRDDNSVFTTTSAVLRKQGSRINLFLDRDVPYCNPAPCGNPDTFHLSHLNDAASIFDNNIYPLLTTVLGDPSDVDSDSRISVVITPIMNRDLRTASYTDSRTLLPFDPIANPGSNESEVIFVYAPDSLGNYKSEADDETDQWFQATADTYVAKALNAWIAFQLTKIISFNQHVFVSDGNAEDDWIDDGMGAVMADLAGFNIWKDGVWEFLSHPQLYDLRAADDFDSPTTIGPEYLFMLYYLQSQVDTTVEDADGDNVDDDIKTVYSALTTSGLTSVENLENAVDFSFDSTKETEFEAIFKDWTIAIATSGSSRTDLQQTNQTAVKYYFTLNPTVFGSGITNAAGSTRTGATGYDVGVDLNNRDPEEGVLIENADEHTLAPGNSMYGYIDPYAAMYVRLGGLFQSTQTISIKGSTSAIKGFLVRRTNVSYPHVYSESTFGSIDQHAEDLQTAGPNPYWTKKVDYASLVSPGSTSGGFSQDYLTIIGRIDSPSKINVCPEDSEDCAYTDVPDTDKYFIEIPALAGRTDEGDLGIVLRRQFDNGLDTSALTPMMAIVSSKDVPYPYVPHPTRGVVVGSTDTRQAYRWMASQLICGDSQVVLTTNVPSESCTVGGDEDSSKIIFDGLAENTGDIELSDGSNWNGDILGTGTECATVPALDGVVAAGYGANGLFDVTAVETSPSALGTYPWVNTLNYSFMEISYNGGKFPDVLFAREFLKNVTGYPSTDEDSMYDPRSTNGLTSNCHVNTTAESDTSDDSPDNFLEAGEIKAPTTLAEQILTEMSRGRIDGTGGTEASHFTGDNAKFNDTDVFAIDGDSRDKDTVCVSADLGNNLNQWTVRSGEGSMLWGGSTAGGDYSWLEPHIRDNLNNSALDASTLVLPLDTTGGQRIYTNGSQTTIRLQAGLSYTIIVAGTGSTTGSYELRLRKISATAIDEEVIKKSGSTDKCYHER